MQGVHTEYLNMTAGKHVLTLQYLSGSDGANVDCIVLTYAGDMLPSSTRTYEAEAADFNQLGAVGKPSVKTENTLPGYTSSGYVTGLHMTTVERGGGVRFIVMAEENGLHDVTLRYSSEAQGNIRIYIGNTAKTWDRLVTSLPLTNTDGEWGTVKASVFLERGINVIDLDTDVDAALDCMTVSRIARSEERIIGVEAEDCHFVGNIRTEANDLSSAGSYVKGILASADAENQLIIKVCVPEAGLYRMVIYHSNGELFGGHDYNAQLVDRFATISVNDSAPQNIFFRNTYSDETFKTRVVDVFLRPGDNTIRVYNDDSRRIRCGIMKEGTISYQTLVNYTPNFDKFEFFPACLE